MTESNIVMLYLSGMIVSLSGMIYFAKSVLEKQSSTRYYDKSVISLSIISVSLLPIIYFLSESVTSNKLTFLMATAAMFNLSLNALKILVKTNSRKIHEK